MLITLVAPLVMIVGMLVYAMAGNPKVQQLGWGAYCVGLFFTVAMVARQAVRLL